MQRSIHVTGKSGHTDTLYRTDEDLRKGEVLQQGEVDEAAARAVFDQIRAEGRVPFAVEEGKAERELKSFDPKVQETLVVSPIAGG